MKAETTGRGRTSAILGAVLQIGTVISLVKAFPGVANCFHAVVYNGLGDPATLLPAFSEIFETVAVGLAVGAVGLILMTVALVGSRYRAPWWFWFLVVYGGILLLVFPVGTGFGAFFLGYCLARRREFLPSVARG